MVTFDSKWWFPYWQVSKEGSKQWWEGRQQPMEFTYSYWTNDEKNVTDVKILSVT